MWPPEPSKPANVEEEEPEPEEEPDEDSWESLPAAEKLQDVLDCLRTRHAYCLFCGCEVSPYARLLKLVVAMYRK